jgi:hypothetical protein
MALPCALVIQTWHNALVATNVFVCPTPCLLQLSPLGDASCSCWRRAR